MEKITPWYAPLVKKVIEWSEENSAGLIMNQHSIVEAIWTINEADIIRFDDESKSWKIKDTDKIDEIMENLESDAGYLVKASDLKGVMELYYDDKIKT